MSIVNPRQTVLVTCREEMEILGKKTLKDNIIVLDWHMPLSFDPQMYAICVGKSRFSLELIRRSGVFAVNFIPFSMKKKVIFCGRNSGKHIDKFQKAGINKMECENIDCPRIGEALAFMECEVVEEIETGDHIVFVARVVSSSEQRKGSRIYHLHGNDFTTTAE